MTGALTFKEHGHLHPVDPMRFGDIVIARKDMPTSYHLAVVVDDAYQQVSLVTRGEDLLAAAHIQRLLQALLKLPEPAYAHHPLVLDEQGRKFSKRDGAVSLQSLAEAGLTPPTSAPGSGSRPELDKGGATVLIPPYVRCSRQSFRHHRRPQGR